MMEQNRCGDQPDGETVFTREYFDSLSMGFKKRFHDAVKDHGRDQGQHLKEDIHDAIDALSGIRKKPKLIDIEFVDGYGRRIEFRKVWDGVAIHADESGVAYVGKDSLREVGQWFFDVAEMNDRRR